MNRLGQYKDASQSHEGRKITQRMYFREHHKEKRFKAFNLKRVKLVGNDTEKLSHEKVCNAASQLGNKLGDLKEPLSTLCRAFAQDKSFVDAFLGLEGSLPSLIGILSGNNVDLQLSAAWCLTNMAVGSHAHAWKVLTTAGPYFITYLQSGSVPLQDQCGWALGNIAGDCQKCRKTLVAQGAIVPLVDLLHSMDSGVSQSAAFALSNLVQGGSSVIKQLLEQGILSGAAIRLQFSATSLDKQLSVETEVAWMCFHVICGVSDYQLIQESGVDDVVTNAIITLANDPSINIPELSTPLLRCAGNLSCFKEYRDRLRQPAELVSALFAFMNSNYSHIKKETLWVLSNLTVDSALVDILHTRDFLTLLLNLLLSPPDALKELLICFCHISSLNRQAKDHLIKAGLVPALLPCLQSSDSDSVKLCVKLIGILNSPVSEKIVSAASLTTSLEALQHNENDEVKSLVCDLLSVLTKAESVS